MSLCNKKKTCHCNLITINQYDLSFEKGYHGNLIKLVEKMGILNSNTLHGEVQAHSIGIKLC